LGICLMDVLLLGAIDLAVIGNYFLVALMVAVGLGTVIFVHELGHFAVAKMCGVKCEKFFIGFDIGGYKISRKWGETEYGIGILPLGGYVKMLGQDDNPANIAEQVRESQVREGSSAETKEIVGPDGTKYLVDSRSYLAKSVPQRMAIISAGVIMNVIFAFVFAVIAYGLGVPYTPCIVSQTSPGSAAYQAGIRTGDEITRIGDIKNPSFTDLMSGVTLGDLENGIPFTIRRVATGEEDTITLKPRQETGLAKVGIVSPRSLRLGNDKPVVDGTPAAAASPKFEAGDDIVAVDGEPVESYHEYVAKVVNLVGEPIVFTVQRGGKAPKNDRFGPRQGGEQVEITVAPKPTRTLGLVMEMGKIVAVEQGSEAANLKIVPGDFIDKIELADGDATEGSDLFSDPMALPEQLRRLANENRNVQLTVRHSAASGDGRQETEPVTIPLRKVTWIEEAVSDNDPLSVPALGIAYRVLNRVNQVLPGSPAAEAGVQSRDLVTAVEITFPAKDGAKTEKPTTIEFNEQEGQNWPAFMQHLQHLSEDVKITLTYKRGDEILTAELRPQVQPDSFEPERGFRFEPIQRIRKATTFGEQVRFGYNETVNSLGMVFRFLHKLSTGQVPATSLGGPITIAQAAGYSAFEGVGKLLVFLTMLSANLAVINFLPIPLLDGGHMVFLAWEGLRGKPAGEKLVFVLHFVGFAFIVSLMLFVLSLDLGLIDRKL
jgi:regulator of sigma E protease